MVILLAALSAMAQQTPHWVKQKQETTNFRFEIFGKQATGEFADDGAVIAIKIINRKDGSVQLLKDINAYLRGPIDEVVQVQDCNFDIYSDFWIFAHTGGAGPNYGNNYYLYNPKTHQFAYNKQLSWLTQPFIDTKSKEITSEFRDGCCHHGGATYTFKNGRLDTLSTWDNAWNHAGLFGAEVHSTKINGHWVDSVQYQATILPDSTPVFTQTGKILPQKFYKSDYVMIKQHTPLQVEVSGYNKKGQTVQGWIAKSAILTTTYKSVTAETLQYQFKVNVDQYVDEESSPVFGIKVIRKSNHKTVQIIPLYQNIYAAYTPDFLQVSDYNHDGAPDFRLKLYSNSKTEQSYRYFYFNRKKKLFQSDKNRK